MKLREVLRRKLALIKAMMRVKALQQQALKKKP